MSESCEVSNLIPIWISWAQAFWVVTCTTLLPLLKHLVVTLQVGSSAGSGVMGSGWGGIE